MTRVPRSVFFLLFTVSGFAGLIYESIWSHYLKLFLGHAAYAQTLVLALFMGGMAIGSWLCSRWSQGWKNLLRGYAAAEALIGLAAFLFHPIFVAATDSAYTSILPALGGETSAALFKWTLAGTLILPQSILLGMTFPLMSAGLIRRYPAAPGESLAMLYFTNSFGAAIGVLASGFVMIEALGLPGTMQVAGAMNLVLAAAVWLLARDAEPPLAARAPARSEASGDHRLLLAVALLTGAAAFVFEIGWIRMLSLVLGSSTHSFELMLSAFILGIACGGYWIRRRIDSIADPTGFLGVVLTIMGLLALATLPLYGQMFGLMRVVIEALARTDAGYALFLVSSHGIALAVMFPATFCAGMTLPLITYALLRGGEGEKAIGAVYSANTLGSILGVFFAAHLGMPLLGLKGLIACGAALDAGLGLVLLWRASGARRLRLAAAALSLVCFAAVLAGVQLDPYKMASGVFRHGDLYTTREATMIMHRDGKTTTVSLMDFGTDRSLRTNGKSDGAINMDPEGPRVSDEVTMTLTAAIPLAHRPDAATAAVIGIGTGLTTHTLLGSSALRSVETIEIEPAMAEASRRFAPRNSSAFADPRSHIVFDDAKTFFSTHNRKYDIIISEPSNPWVSGVSSLFTSEFYRLVRRHLNEDGVLVQWFQMYEIDSSLIASVLRALGESFPDYAVYAATGSDLLIVAGESRTLARPITDILATMPGVARELRRVQVNSIRDIEVRRIGGKRSLGALFLGYGVPANSDYYPYLDLHAAKYRFLHQSADELTGLLSYGVPVVALLEERKSVRADPKGGGQEYLEALELARRAGYAKDYLLAAKQPEPVAIPRPFQKDLELARARLIECRDVGRSDIWFHSLYELSRILNPMLSADEATAVWERIERAPCAAQLTADQRQWIDLFRAVGERSAPGMGRIAEALLAKTSDLPSGHRQYLIAAGMAGYLAQGQRAEAATLWNRYPADADRSGDVGLRLLYAHAFPASGS
jgi:spermidine synthase